MRFDRKYFYGFLYGLVMALLAAGVLLVVARRPAGQPLVLRDAPTPAPLRVYVVGAVVRPGVYPLPRQAIVQDALAAAGGPSARADTAGLNLAQPVQDGDRLRVPEQPPTATPVPPTRTPAPTLTVGAGTPSPTPAPTETTAAAGAAPALVPGEKLDLNTATAAQLDALPRIGPATAERILAYRDQHGPFTKIEDLLNVKGIGAATFDQLKDLIFVR